MISNISFGGTYKVKMLPEGQKTFGEKEMTAYQKFAQMCEEIEEADFGTSRLENSAPETEEVGRYTVRTSLPKQSWELTRTLVVNDALDKHIESYCRINGIQFKKLAKSELERAAIINRVKEAPKGYKKVTVDVNKLKEIASKQDSNLKHCEKDYNYYYYTDTEFIKKSGNKFATTSLYIAPNGGKLEDTIEYIESYGADKLNEGQIAIHCSQRTNEPDHCMLFALCDGIENKVPVYLNKDSLKLAQALGVVVE